MQQVLIKGGIVTVREVPVPTLAPGQVLVRVSHSLISTGTESSFVGDGGTAGYVLKKARDPLNLEKVKRKLASVGLRDTIRLVRNKLFEYQTPGFSTAGIIVDVGEGVYGLSAGDRVACSGGGYACHAEYNVVPQQLITPIPDGMSLEEGAFVTLGAIAMQGVRQAQPTFGETLVVVGLGLLGQLAVQIARNAGCHVIGCDPVESKQALASELGADAVCSPQTLDETVREWTGGYGADAVVICAASKSSGVTNDALDICRQKGRVAVVGAVGMALDREPMYLNELDFRLSCSYGPGRYQPAYEEGGLDYPIGYVRWTQGRNMAEFLRMVASGKVRVAPLVSETFSVKDAEKAYNKLGDRDSGLIAALLVYAGATGEAQPDLQPLRRVDLRRSSAVSKTSVGIAVIGAGNFARNYHLPNIRRIDGARLEAVCARKGGALRDAAERFRARYCTTDYRHVLADHRVDAVVIATQHDLHAQIAQEAAAAGKHVFVEKPLGLSVEACEAACDAIESAGVVCAVGFNRRFSPLATALRDGLHQTHGPRVLHYRCNAGAVDRDHWVNHATQGGGRILGEAVHFVDFCVWLIGHEPESMQATFAGAAPNGGVPPDNLSLALRFPGRHVANIVYTTVGSPLAGKERLEAFSSGGTAVLDDFRTLRVYGMPGRPPRGSRERKGQFECLRNFVRAVQGEEELGVTAADGLRATRLAVEAIRVAHQFEPNEA